MAFYAHRRELPGGGAAVQTVREHLIETAERASCCLQAAGLESAGYLAGLLHDMGKLTDEFQSYLSSENGTRGSVIHTFQGCRYLMENYHGRGEPELSAAAELIAFAVGAHHGLFDFVDPGRRIGLEYRAQKQDIAYEEAAERFRREMADWDLDELFSKAASEIERALGRMGEAYADDFEFSFEVGLLARLILSAVIEGDRRDTAKFVTGVKAREWPENMSPIWSDRLGFLEEKLDKLQKHAKHTPVNEARRDVSEQCRAFAENAPGIYRLNVPTGGGKTLSSLRYALAHAARHNKSRVIFVSPLLSILEQNAGVIHEFVGDDALILEHHSNAVQTGSEKGELDERELLVQSWDAPIIITTLVQLLGAMLDGKTTSIRRFQALCGSVIVIDEVQTVPSKMLTLFSLAIQFLSEQCGATVILCSATQPELEGAHHPLRKSPEEMVKRDERLWAAFRRTELSVMPERRLSELPELIREKMEENASLLAVCNKKSEAAFLLEETRSPDWRSFHLSAAMCMQHRRDVLSEMLGALRRGERVLCAATQVIEAGVDISFGSVLRLTAGMDSIVQAAGRCNRGGEAETPCMVYAVNCSDERLGMLRDIQLGKNASIELMSAFESAPERFEGNLFSDSAIRYYYRALYRDMAEGEQDYFVPAQGTTLFDLMSINEKYADGDCENLDSFLLHQALKTAGELFTVFDENTTDVLVPYGRGKKLIEELCSEKSRRDPGYRAALLKEACSYTVGVYAYQKKLLEQQNALIQVCDGCALVLADGYYDEEVGLRAEAGAQKFMEV